ncbi:MAG: hypothetical protein ACPL4C_03780 [Brevinematia bacterium]|jgi:hypothetical protein
MLLSIVVFLVILTCNLYPQETAFLTNDITYTNDLSRITNFSYRGIAIGMTKSNVESLIEEDEFLRIDETSYLGLFDKEKPFVLKAISPPYIQSIYFVFNNNILFNIIIRFNPEIYSYSELLREGKKKYGPPVDEFPDLSIWKYGEYELRVEKPATVKFFLTSQISNITIKSYESSKKIKERSEYSKKQLFPF